MIKKILATTEGLDFSERGVSYALDIAKRHSASVTLVHIFLSADGRPRTRLRKLDKDVIRTAEKFLEDAAGKMKAESIKTNTKILLSKSVSGAILKEAKSDEYDLIVMCAKDMCSRKRFLVGSTAEEVIKKAPCPVFVYL